VITDLEGNIEYVNPKFSKITGYSEEYVRGKKISMLNSGSNSKDEFKELWNLITSGNEWQGEFQNRKKNGDLFWERALISPIFDSKNNIINYLKVAEDITTMKKNAIELLKMEKLRSIGVLAGGIAHDFNNILTGIYGNVSLALMELSENHPSYQLLSETEKSINRASKLTRQLLTFSKGGSPVKKNVNLSRIIKETALFDLSGSNLKSVFNFDKNLFNAIVDEGQIQQVFSNLTINAKQASPEGGHLYFTVVNICLIDDNVLELKPGNYLKITIQDEGVGISKEYIDKVFDPYFTTKKTGSGLGLATTFSIINRHNGFLGIDSEVGKGTKFTIYLPATESIENKKYKKNEQLDKKKNIESPRILIMDDEDAICKLLSRMIIKLGYESDTATDGDQAIDKYSKALDKKTPYDIVIMDLTIPGGMGGKVAVRKILDINEYAKVIVSSGYTSSSALAEYKSFGFIDMIDKPFTIAKLKEVISRVLDNNNFS